METEEIKKHIDEFLTELKGFKPDLSPEKLAEQAKAAKKKLKQKTKTFDDLPSGQQLEILNAMTNDISNGVNYAKILVAVMEKWDIGHEGLKAVYDHVKTAVEALKIEPVLEQKVEEPEETAESLTETMKKVAKSPAKKKVEETSGVDKFLYNLVGLVDALALVSEDTVPPDPIALWKDDEGKWNALLMQDYVLNKKGKLVPAGLLPKDLTMAGEEWASALTEANIVQDKALGTIIDALKSVNLVPLVQEAVEKAIDAKVSKLLEAVKCLKV